MGKRTWPKDGRHNVEVPEEKVMPETLPTEVPVETAAEAVETPEQLKQLAAERTEEVSAVAETLASEQAPQIQEAEAIAALPSEETREIRQQTGTEGALQELADAAHKTAALANEEIQKVVAAETWQETSASDAEALTAWRAHIDDVFAGADAQLAEAERSLEQGDTDTYEQVRKAAEDALAGINDELTNQELISHPSAKELIAWWVAEDGKRAERIEEMDERANTALRAAQQHPAQAKAENLEEPQGVARGKTPTLLTTTERERDEILGVLDRIAAGYEAEVAELTREIPPEAASNDVKQRHSERLQKNLKHLQLLQKLIAQNGVAGDSDVRGIRAIRDSRNDYIKRLQRDQEQRKKKEFREPSLTPQIVTAQQYVQTLEAVLAEHGNQREAVHGTTPESVESVPAEEAPVQSPAETVLETGTEKTPEEVTPEEAIFENEGGGQQQGMQPASSPEAETLPANVEQKDAGAAVEKVVEEAGKITASDKKPTPKQVTNVEQVVEVLGTASPEAAKAAKAAEKEIQEAQKNPSRWERMKNWLKSKDEGFKKDIKAEGGIGVVAKSGKFLKLLKYGFLFLFFAISSILYMGLEATDKKRH